MINSPATSHSKEIKYPPSHRQKSSATTNEYVEKFHDSLTKGTSGEQKKDRVESSPPKHVERIHSVVASVSCVVCIH